MSIKYVPILRWKTGEKNCLETLSFNISNSIIPFVEVSPPSVSQDDEAAAKKLSKLISSFNDSWENKPFFLYLTEDWYNDADSPYQVSEIYENIFKLINHPKTIPAFDITDEFNISNATNLPNDNGICLRISGNNFESLREDLNNYVTNSLIVPQNTDLLLDLKYISEDTYLPKAALAAAISDISNISSYRRIIVASCSFPKSVSDLHSDIVNEFKRYETDIHKKSLDLQETFGFNYIYADYGPMNLNDTPFVIGMIPNFKIKYSSHDKYLIVKGLSLKKGGLDLINVVACCQKLIQHPQYSGCNFSHGDKIIYDTASGVNKKSGNLTNWVGYSFNHHITLMVSLL